MTAALAGPRVKVRKRGIYWEVLCNGDFISALLTWSTAMKVARFHLMREHQAPA